MSPGFIFLSPTNHQPQTSSKCTNLYFEIQYLLWILVFHPNLYLISSQNWDGVCPMPPLGLFLLFLSIIQRKKRNCSRFPPFSPCTQYTTKSTPKRASSVSCGQHITGVLFPVLTLHPELCKVLRLWAHSFHPRPPHWHGDDHICPWFVNLESSAMTCLCLQVRQELRKMHKIVCSSIPLLFCEAIELTNCTLYTTLFFLTPDWSFQHVTRSVLLLH